MVQGSSAYLLHSLLWTWRHGRARMGRVVLGVVREGQPAADIGEDMGNNSVF